MITFSKLLSSRSFRPLFLVAIYSTVFFLSLYLAYLLRFDFRLPTEFVLQFKAHWAWVIALKLAILLLFGQFAGLLSYFSIPDLRRLFFATVASSGVLLAVRYSNPVFFPMPRGVLLADFILSFVGVSVVRVFFRVLRERYFSPQSKSQRRRRRVGSE